MASIPAAWIPGATYRVQLNHGFTFADAAALVPYLAALGIDTLYASPILLSAPGSLHGYDVNDYRRIDSDLGGRAGFEQLAAALDEAGLRLLLDFVPNHMGIDGPFNLWWRDVLESGRDSPHARFFDIFWDTRSDDRIYLPMLEDHYGRVLEAGKLRLQYHAGELAVAYGHTTFPLALGTYALVLEPLTAAPGLADDTRASLHDWFAACAKLEGRRRPSRRRETLARARKRLALKQRLAGIVDASPPLAAAIEARLTTLNGRAGDPASVDALDAVIERQHYRLA
jgi:(1->4)-alpha-D-glucan 1-alpha-D-glucosylmutase